MHQLRAIDLKNASLENLNRLINEAEKACWTIYDEEILHKLQMKAEKLLSILK